MTTFDRYLCFLGAALLFIEGVLNYKHGSSAVFWVSYLLVCRGLEAKNPS